MTEKENIENRRIREHIAKSTLAFKLSSTKNKKFQLPVNNK